MSCYILLYTYIHIHHIYIYIYIYTQHETNKPQYYSGDILRQRPEHHVLAPDGRHRRRGLGERGRAALGDLVRVPAPVRPLRSLHSRRHAQRDDQRPL